MGNIGDVATAFERAINDEATSRQAYDLGGPAILTLRKIVRFVCTTSCVPAHVIERPAPVAVVEATRTDFGAGRPVTTDNYC